MFKHSCLYGDRISRPRRGNPAPALLLTSLIDAFAILVIYLLMNFGDPSQIQKEATRIDLPQSKSYEETLPGLTLQIKDHKIFYNQRELSQRDLPKLFKAADRKSPIVIEGQKHASFSEVNPLILAASQAGLSHITFVTTREER